MEHMCSSFPLLDRLKGREGSSLVPVLPQIWVFPTGQCSSAFTQDAPDPFLSPQKPQWKSHGADPEGHFPGLAWDAVSTESVSSVSSEGRWEQDWETLCISAFKSKGAPNHPQTDILFLWCLQKRDATHSRGALPRIGPQFPPGPTGIQGVLPTNPSQAQRKGHFSYFFQLQVIRTCCILWLTPSVPICTFSPGPSSPISQSFTSRLKGNPVGRLESKWFSPIHICHPR